MNAQAANILGNLDILVILGIAISVIMILLGIALLFGKSNTNSTDAAASITTDITNKPTQIDLFTHLPIGSAEQHLDKSALPETAKPQSKTSPTEDLFQRVIPTNHNTPEIQEDDFNIIPIRGNSSVTEQAAVQPAQVFEFDKVDTSSAEVKQHSINAESSTVAAEPITPNTTLSNDLQIDSPTEAPVQSAALLNTHLDDQVRRDQHSTLAKAEKIIAIYLIPREGSLDGAQLLTLLRSYGLRFGEMSLFHRFKNTNGTGPLMFSVLKYSSDGAPSGFDLMSLVQDQIEGLAFFLALPNEFGLEGFDTLMHVVEKMSRDLDAQVFDEDMCKITRQSYEYLRQQASSHV